MAVTLVDHALIAVLLVALPAYGAWEYPRLSRRLVADAGAARAAEYKVTIAVQWTLAGILLVSWTLQRYPLATLGLVVPDGAALAWSIGAVVLTGFVLGRQLVAVRRHSRFQQQVRDQIARQPTVAAVLPRTAHELRWFAGAAITAGFCEELLYRGFLWWYLTALNTPAPLAFGTAVLAFGVAHAYQGVRGMLLTGVSGAVALVLYLMTESLVAPMLLHAAIDLVNGAMGYLALTTGVSGDTSAGA